MESFLSVKVARTCTVVLLGLALAACNSKSDPTKENFAKAVQAHLDGIETVCVLAGLVPFDAPSFAYAVTMAEPLVKVGLLTKTPTTVRDTGAAHTLLPGFHYALTEEGKKAYRPANPAIQSTMCGGKSKVMAITGSTSAGPKPQVGDTVDVTYTAKLVERPRWDDEATLRPKHFEVLETTNDMYRGEYILELTNDGWAVRPTPLLR